MLIYRPDFFKFEKYKGGIRRDFRDFDFQIPIRNGVAILTGMNVRFTDEHTTPPSDHEFGNLEVGLTTGILNVSTVCVTATYGLRDWSGTYDDNYEGEIYFVVVASESKLENYQLADMPEATIKGREPGIGTGRPQDLTTAQATAILDAFVADNGTDPGTKGLVPAPAPGDAAAHKLLAASGGWVAPVPAQPQRTLFVAKSLPSGADPSIYFGTIGAALIEAATMTPAQGNPVAIVIYPGAYTEDIDLKSWVFLSSATTDQNAVTIKGKVTWTAGTSTKFEVVQLYFLSIGGATTVDTRGKGLGDPTTQNGQTSFILHGCQLGDLTVEGRSATDESQRDYVFAVTCAQGGKSTFKIHSCLFEWVAGRVGGMTFDTPVGRGDCSFRIIGSTSTVPFAQDWFVNGTATGICTGTNFTKNPWEPDPLKSDKPEWTFSPQTKTMFRGCSLGKLNKVGSPIVDVS